MKTEQKFYLKDVEPASLRCRLSKLRPHLRATAYEIRRLGIDKIGSNPLLPLRVGNILATTKVHRKQYHAMAKALGCCEIVLHDCRDLADRWNARRIAAWDIDRKRGWREGAEAAPCASEEQIQWLVRDIADHPHSPHGVRERLLSAAGMEWVRTREAQAGAAATNWDAYWEGFYTAVVAYWQEREERAA